MYFYRERRDSHKTVLLLTRSATLRFDQFLNLCNENQDNHCRSEKSGETKELDGTTRPTVTEESSKNRNTFLFGSIKNSESYSKNLTTPRR